VFPKLEFNFDPRWVFLLTGTWLASGRLAKSGTNPFGVGFR
jgi:hypothetical protein